MSKIVYLNVKNGRETETVDHVNRADFADNKSFYAEIKRLKSEYRLAHSYYAGIYSSQRHVKGYW